MAVLTASSMTRNCASRSGLSAPSRVLLLACRLNFLFLQQLAEDDIADEGFGTGGPGNRLLAHRDFDLIAGRSRVRLDQMFIRRRQY